MIDLQQYRNEKNNLSKPESKPEMNSSSSGRLAEEAYSHVEDRLSPPAFAPPAASFSSRNILDSCAEASNLRALAATRINSPADKTNFMQNMECFENRARSQHLSNEQQAAVYQQISRLMTADRNALTNPEKISNPRNHVDLAEELMWHAAEPSKIAQGGQHKTCSVAALESEMFTRDPADACRLVTEVAINGSFKTRGTDGLMTVYLPDPSILAPDKEGQQPIRDGQRTYSSHIFQGVAVQIAMQKNGITFAQARKGESSETGEWLIGKAGVRAFQGVENQDLAFVNEQITHGRNPITVIEYKTTAQVSNDSTAIICRQGASQVVDVDDKKGLETELVRLKSAGQMPAIISVFTNCEPFWVDYQGTGAGGDGGRHDVCIDNYDPATGRVSLNNEWSSAADYRFEDNRSISLQQLSIAIRPRQDDQLKNLELEIGDNRMKKIYDPSMELEYGRRMWEKSLLGVPQYQAQAANSLAIAENRVVEARNAVVKLQSNNCGGEKALLVAQQKYEQERQQLNYVNLQFQYMNTNFRAKTGVNLRSIQSGQR